MRRNRTGTSGPNLLPLLDVLLCTMGTLIVVLGVVNGEARLHPTKRLSPKAQAAAAHSLELKEASDDWQLQIDQLSAARDKTQLDMTNARTRLAGIEDHSRELRDQLLKLSADAKALHDNDESEKQRDDYRREIDALNSRRLQLAAAINNARAQAGNQKAVYAVIPFEGMYHTSRRPIYIECRGDAVILQPEGIVFAPQDFLGPGGPSNPLAAAVRAAQEYWRYAPTDGGVPNEPYPLLLVRPEGIIAYYLARDAMSSWNAEFGYELIGSDWKLDFPIKPDNKLKDMEASAVAEARERLQWLAQASPESFNRSKPKTEYRLTPMRGGVVREGGPALGKDPFADDPLGGFGKTGGGRNGPGGPGGAYANGGPGGAGGGPGGNGLGNRGPGGSGDGPAFAGGTRQGNSAFGNGGQGTGTSAFAGSGGAGTSAFGGTGAGQGTSAFGGTGTGALGGGAGQGNAFGAGGGSQNGLAGSPLGQGGTGTGLNGGTGNSTFGSGGSGMGDGTGGPSLTMGSGSNTNGGTNGTSPGPEGLGSANGAYAGGGSGSNPNISDVGPRYSGNGTGNGTGTAIGTPGGNVAQSGQYGNGAPGGQSGGQPGGQPGKGRAGGGPPTSEYGGVAWPGSAGGGESNFDPNAPAGGGQSGAGSENGQYAGGGQYPGGGPTFSDVAGLSNMPGGSPGGSSGEMSGSSGGSSYGGSSSSGSSSSSGGGSSMSSGGGSSMGGDSLMGNPSSGVPTPMMNFSNQKQNNFAQNRGKNWALPSSSATSIPLTRPIRIECYPDRLVLLPDTRDQQAQVIPLPERTDAAVDQLVSAVRGYTKTWGMAGRSMYWKPQLVLEIKPSGDRRAADLQALLADSGLDITRR